MQPWLSGDCASGSWSMGCGFELKPIRVIGGVRKGIRP